MSANRGGWSDDEYDDRRDPARRVGPPAIGLIVVAVLGLVGSCVTWAALNSLQRNQPKAPPPPNVDKQAYERGQAAAPLFQACLLGVPSVAMHGLVLAGGITMQRLRARGLGITAAILAMLPCGPAVLVGIPIGIWALVVLFNRDVADAFARRARRRRDDW